MRKSSPLKSHYRPGTSRGHLAIATFREQMTDFARGDRLLELRAERRLSRETVAHEIGVTTKTLFTWEKQSGAIKSENAKRIADFYGIDDWQDLVTRDPEATGPSSRGQVGEGFTEFREHVADIRGDIAELKHLLTAAAEEREAIQALLKEQDEILKEMQRVAGTFPDPDSIDNLTAMMQDLADRAEAEATERAEDASTQAETRRRAAEGP